MSASKVTGGFADEEEATDATAVASRAVVSTARTQVTERHRPWLVVVQGGDILGRMYALDRRITMGRSPSSDVRIDEGGVSRNHAVIELTPGEHPQIADLGSRNGTFVNGARVTRETLRDGDKIQIGGATILKFSYQDELDEALQRNLYESATSDPLTRVANKRSFTAALGREAAFAVRHRRPLSLVALDVDHFKRINDAHGHLGGDDVLRRLAEIISSAIGADDLFARVGGEEFAILLREDHARAIEVAEGVRRLIEQATFEHRAARIEVTISLGVATLSMGGSDPSTLVEAADRALYEAKRTGRNRVCGARGA
jgi:diguanylate cyclase (GGDEF)-like protein